MKEDLNEINKNITKARELEEKGEFFASSFYYKKALNLSIPANDSINIKFCKNKLVDVNKKAIASGKDFKEISLEHQISEDGAQKIDKAIDLFLSSSDINEFLKKVGNSTSFTPRLEHVRKSAKQTIPISYSFASISTISNAGHVLAGSDNGDISWFMNMYDISQKVIVDLYLTPLIKKLLVTKSKKRKFNFKNVINSFLQIIKRILKIKYRKAEFNLKNVAAYFQQSNILKQDNLDIINCGLEAYFSGNYISCLHILIPQFESAFLKLSEKFGIDIVALDRKLGIATRTKTLSNNHLLSEEFIKVWGEDFCFQINFVLFETLGYKLRHKIAHGEILKNECNFDNCNLVLYFFLVLLGRTRPVFIQR